MSERVRENTLVEVYSRFVDLGGSLGEVDLERRLEVRVLGSREESRECR